jgi:large subunit ribosomal protein L21
MFAVIRTGGKQYKVAKNDVIFVEKLPAEAGASIDLDDVLMFGDEDGTTAGTPELGGVHVTATVLEQKRDDKIIVFKKKRRHNYRRKNGHRQYLTVLRITDIVTAASDQPVEERGGAEIGSAATGGEPGQITLDATAPAGVPELEPAAVE